MDKPPPVPPRRKKRCLISKDGPSVQLGATSTTPVNQLVREPCLPAPEIQVPESINMHVCRTEVSEAPRSNNNASVDPDQARRSTPTAMTSSPTKCSLAISTQVPQSHRNNDGENRGEFKSEIEAIRNITNTDGNEGDRMPKKYAPLLFTLRDFQDVTANSEFPSLDKNSKDSSPASSFEDEEELNFFRLTTKNSPFEKYLGDLGAVLGGSEFPVDNDSSDSFIFEDYINRSTILTSTKNDLFMENVGDEEVENVEEITGSCGKFPRVRFIIQAPSDSISDDCEISEIVNNPESMIEDEKQHWWLTGRSSPLIITEILDSPPTIEPVNNDLMDEIDISSQPHNSSGENVLEIEENAPQMDDSENFPPIPYYNSSFQSLTNETKVSNENSVLSESPVEIPLSPPIFKDVGQIPTKIRRDFFFENMLSEDDPVDENSTCSIIATHPKLKALIDPTNGRKSPEEKSSSALDKDNGSSNILVSSFIAVQNGFPSSGNDPRPRPKVPPKPSKSSRTNESTYEAKSEVLNELLSNFSSIKLRSVEEEKSWHEVLNIRGKIPIQDDEKKSEISLTNRACSVGEKTDEKLNEKTSLINNSQVRKIGNDLGDANDNGRDNHDDKCGNELESSAVIENKCAIVNSNPTTRRNNNDNNKNTTMTDVAVSYDQAYCDAVSIAIVPGRVRSFVENYETNVDKTCKHSKSNDSFQVVEKNEEKMRLNIDICRDEELKFLGDTDKQGLIECPRAQVETTRDDGYTTILRQNQQEKSTQSPQLISSEITPSETTKPYLERSLVSSPGEKENYVKSESRFAVIHVDKSKVEGLEKSSVRRKAKKKAPRKPEPQVVDGEKYLKTLQSTTGSIEHVSQATDLREEYLLYSKGNKKSENISQPESTDKEDLEKSGISTLDRQPEPYFLKTPFVFYLEL